MSDDTEQLSENIDKLTYAVEDLARVMPELVNNLGSFMVLLASTVKNLINLLSSLAKVQKLKQRRINSSISEVLT